jgi:integrase
MYARSVNSFLTWAHGEGLLPERLRIRLLPDPPKPLTPISDAEMRRLVLFRPHDQLQVRTWTLILLLLDTGLRIDEALGLDRDPLPKSSRRNRCAEITSRNAAVRSGVDVAP